NTLHTDSGNDLPEEAVNMKKLLRLTISAIIEMRFESTENYFTRSGLHQLVDLPCGYTSRGLRLAQKGFTYYGCDIPAVIDEFLPVVKNFLSAEDMKSIHYSPVDATNYDSLRNALKDSHDGILITTEGMLMYFTQSELEEVFRNIHRLLDEFGGRWITLDRLLSPKTEEIRQTISGNFTGNKADFVRESLSARSIDVTDNVMFSDDEEQTRKFIHDMGFDLTFDPVKDYLPEKLHSINALSEEKQQAVRRILEGMCYYVMTTRKTKSSSASNPPGQKFTAQSTMSGGTLSFHISGRLDTISAPKLLDMFRERQKENNFQAVEINMSDLDYISSAGLRVLMIMFKALPPGGFRMFSIKPTVQEILQTTGFDSLLRNEA
ncbi:MAG: STAS domain-containing protein, partial [Synergistaceae bacterium]|nr:STAS domain-containing protein [Synergistaceae bacterium]